jgi:hypothetical protein
MEVLFTGTSILKFSARVLLNCVGLGSGITIYGLQLPGFPVKFNVTIDGSIPQQVSFPAIPLAEKSPTIYNLKLYDNQSLPLSNHDLTIASTGEMFFGYADVNQTDAAPIPSPSSSAPVPSSSVTSPTTSPTPGSSR